MCLAQTRLGCLGQLFVAALFGFNYTSLNPTSQSLVSRSTSTLSSTYFAKIVHPTFDISIISLRSFSQLPILHEEAIGGGRRGDKNSKIDNVSVSYTDLLDKGPRW